jgi:predicted DCC family thiol-disulfide oxidoreductase YuxK
MTPWRLLYDGTCRLCVWSARFLLRLDDGRRLSILTLDGARRAGFGEDMAAEEFDASFHLVSPSGQRWSGADAVVELGRLLGGDRVGRLLRAPPVRRGLGAAYSWITRHRHQISRFLPRP